MSDLVARLKLETNNFDRKVKDAQRSLDQFGLKGTEVGGKLGNLTQILQTNIGSLSKLSLALGAGAAAIKVVGDALKRNEEVMDEWGRVTESAGAVYDGFLNVLNTGDISGYLNNINNIVSAAREAYDAMDELGTFNAFNQINKGKARTKFTQTIADYRQGAATKADAQAAGNAYKAELQTQADKEQAAYEAAIKKIAASRGVDFELLKKALSGSYGEYEDLKALPLSKVDVSYVRGMDGVTRAQYSKPYAANEYEKVGEMLRKLTDEELQNLQALGAQAENTRTEIAGIDRQMARFLGKAETATEKTTTAKATTPDYLKGNLFSTANFGTQMSDIADLLTQQKILSEALKNPADFASSDVYQEVAAKLADINEQVEMWKQGLAYVCQETEDINEAQSEGVKASAATTTNAQGTVDAWQNAAIALQAAASAMNAIDDPSAKIAGTMAQAVASIMLGFAQATASPATGAAGVFGWIAASLSGLATAIAMVSTIKSISAGNYAEGGIVPGASYSGDRLTANVNSGELILNRAQQASIAGQLQQGSSINNGTLSTRIKGGDILIALDNTNRSRGGSRGTYAYSK